MLLLRQCLFRPPQGLPLQPRRSHGGARRRATGGRSARTVVSHRALGGAPHGHDLRALLPHDGRHARGRRRRSRTRQSASLRGAGRRAVGVRHPKALLVRGAGPRHRHPQGVHAARAQRHIERLPGHAPRPHPHGHPPPRMVHVSRRPLRLPRGQRDGDGELGRRLRRLPRHRPARHLHLDRLLQELLHQIRQALRRPALRQRRPLRVHRARPQLL